MTRPALAALWIALLATAGCASVAPATGRDSAPSPAALVQRAHAHARAGDLLRSEQYLVLAVRGGYPLERALPALLDVCLRSSRLRAAIAHANPVLQAHPERDALRYLVATLHLALGQRRLALAQLQRLLRHDPHHDQARALRARVLPGRGERPSTTRAAPIPTRMERHLDR